VAYPRPRVRQTPPWSTWPRKAPALPARPNHRVAVRTSSAPRRHVRYRHQGDHCHRRVDEDRDRHHLVAAHHLAVHLCLHLAVSRRTGDWPRLADLALRLPRLADADRRADGHPWAALGRGYQSVDLVVNGCPPAAGDLRVDGDLPVVGDLRVDVHCEPRSHPRHRRGQCRSDGTTSIRRRHGAFHHGPRGCRHRGHWGDHC